MPKFIEGYTSVQAYVPDAVWERFCAWAKAAGLYKGTAVAAAVKAAIPEAVQERIEMRIPVRGDAGRAAATMARVFCSHRLTARRPCTTSGCSGETCVDCEDGSKCVRCLVELADRLQALRALAEINNRLHADQNMHPTFRGGLK